MPAPAQVGQVRTPSALRDGGVLAQGREAGEEVGVGEREKPVRGGGGRGMKRGKTERETLELNGWGVGDILEGDEGYGPQWLVITAIGEETFLCRWKYREDEGFRHEAGNTTLTCRDWCKVGEIK